MQINHRVLWWARLSLLFIIVIGLISPQPAAASAQAAAPAQISDANSDWVSSFAPQGAAFGPQADPRGTYLIYWEFSAYGDGLVRTDHKRETIKHSYQVSGYAVVRPQFSEEESTVSPVEYETFNKIAEGYDEHDITYAYGCTSWHNYQFTISDPDKYANFQPPFNTILDFPVQDETGNWTMKEPREITRAFYNSYRWRNWDRMDDCYGGSEKVTYFESSDAITAIYPAGGDDGGVPLVGDPSGNYFTGTQTFDYPFGDVTLHVTRKVTVVRLRNCNGQTTVVDANDPGVRHISLRVEATDEMLPMDEGTVRIYATCNGVPVKNAKVRVSVEPVKDSGGHWHTFLNLNTDPNRPRGYLGGNKITADQPYIERTTDDNGVLVLSFEAGRDLKTESIGISGDYRITAAAVDKNGLPAEDTVAVGWTDLVFINDSDHIAREGVTLIHPYNTYASPETATALENMAMDFGVVQTIAAGYTPCLQGWQPRLLVNDISLERGGLFDVVGWDASAGRVTGSFWNPPHYTHTDGTVVDFGILNYPCANNMLRHSIRSLGSGYGTWLSNTTMTLRFEHAAPVLARAAAAGPDLTTSAFLSGRDLAAAAAPGQTVTYALGVDNLKGDQAAPGVVLKATLPAGLTFVSANPAPTRTEGGAPLWELGDLLAEGQPQMIDMQVQVGAGVSVGSQLELMVAATTTGADSNEADNTFVAPLYVQAAGADLTVETDLESVAFVPGRETQVRVNVHNYGTAQAEDALLRLALPAGVELVSADPTQPVETPAGLEWTLGSLGVEAVEELSVTLALTGTMSIGEVLPFTLTAETSNELFPDNNTLVLQAVASAPGTDLAVWVSTLESVGGARQYRLSYSNHGAEVAASAALTVTLPAGVTFVSASPAATALDASTLRWDLGSLQPGQGGVVVLTVQAAGASPLGSILLASLETSTFEYHLDDNYYIQPVFPPAQNGGGGAAAVLFLPLTRK